MRTDVALLPSHHEPLNVLGPGCKAAHEQEHQAHVMQPRDKCVPGRVMGCAGVMARSVADIALFNSIFSTCNTTLPNVSLAGYRIGYPTNWWANLGTEVCPMLYASRHAHCLLDTALLSPAASHGHAPPAVPAGDAGRQLAKGCCLMRHTCCMLAHTCYG